MKVNLGKINIYRYAEDIEGVFPSDKLKFIEKIDEELPDILYARGIEYNNCGNGYISTDSVEEVEDVLFNIYCDFIDNLYI